MSTKLLIVDVDPLIRSSLQVLGESLGYHSQAFDNIFECEKAYSEESVSCIIVEAESDGSAELDRLSGFLKLYPTARIILLCEHCDTTLVVNAMRLGLSNVLEHPFSFQRLREAIEIAIQEKVEYLEQERKRLPSNIANLLTRQEEDIATLLLEGAATKEIASKLDLSVRTIHYRKNVIFRKIGANNRAEAIELLARGKTGVVANV